jgi:hypothetical protein
MAFSVIDPAALTSCSGSLAVQMRTPPEHEDPYLNAEDIEVDARRKILDSAGVT